MLRLLLRLLVTAVLVGAIRSQSPAYYDGGYEFSYSTADSSREESGMLVEGVWRVRGRVSWISPDGQTHAYSYIADNNGYRILPRMNVQLKKLLLPAKPSFMRSGLSSGALASLAG